MTIPPKPKKSEFSNQTDYAREWRRWMSEYDPEYRTKKAASMREYRKKDPEKAKQDYKKTYVKNADVRKKYQRDKWNNNLELNRKKLRDWSDTNVAKTMLRSIRSRCKKEKINLDIDLRYLNSIWPKDNLCPVFGTHMERNRKGESRDSSPSLDRIVPEKGYNKGNVVVVSFKANRMKNNGTVEDLRKVLHFYENQMNFL